MVKKKGETIVRILMVLEQTARADAPIPVAELVNR